MKDDEKDQRVRTPWPRIALGALSGALAGFAALAVADLLAGLARPQAGPIVAVGGASIDVTPAAVKDWAVRRFGTDDKLVLQLGILAVLTALALASGALAVRFRRVSAVGILLLGGVGAAAAVGRPDSTGLTDALPSVGGAAAGALLLYALAGRLTTVARSSATTRPSAVTGAEAGPPPSLGWDRRGFVLGAVSAAAVSTAVGAVGRSLNSTRGRDAIAARDAIVLPAPGSPARSAAGRTGLRVRGISPFVTSNSSFYRVDTALVVPRVDTGDWRLRIHGKGVRRPGRYSFDDLLARDLIERDITLTCVSNEVGGPYVGNARWIGVRLADLLAECGVEPPSRGGPADQLVSRSVDGMTIGTPVEDVMDGRDAMLALGMNGEPLPFGHGFPVRMVVPGLYGFVSACKWIKDIELTTFDSYDPYWVRRGWARRAPIRTGSRIDTPKPFARPASGTVMIAGVAWAQGRGIGRVEVRVDDGPWREADLAAEDTRDTWRQWSLPWQAARGGHTLTVRATDRTGAVQTAERTRTIPDGASGWHSVVVTVE
ncbi:MULTISPECIES: molybdopterin-dependent oxidoreductase [unclassified Streptomyces]|uniref:molybdopterin-dependent oxidoreductase n=1 Tax=unclassified Streptomyces TaxID=2593676 RepID=UPI0033FA0E69